MNRLANQTKRKKNTYDRLEKQTATHELEHNKIMMTDKTASKTGIGT